MGASPSGGLVVRFDIFELDLKTGELRKAGAPICLPPQPLKILALLASRAGELVTREEIQRHIWGNETFVDFEQGLNFAIRKIRSALGDDAETPRFIETFPRRGYRFIALVENAPALAVPPNPPITDRFTRKVVSTLVDAVLEKHRARRRWKGVAAAFVGAVLLAFGFVLNPSAWWPRLLGRPNPSRINSVAVLPLEDLSGDSAQDYFADGMTDELITDLAKLSALRVISRTSAMRYKGTRKRLADIARELNVDAVVEGTVVRSGDKVRITAQLIRVADDKHLWADAYERNLGDVLALQGEVAAAVAREIKTKLAPEEQTRQANVRPVNPDAYDAYLRGLYAWNRRTAKDLEKASEYFSKAVEIDPTYAPAYAGLADANLVLGSWAIGALSPDQAFPRAKSAALKAVELDERLAEAHTSLATVKTAYEWDFAGAENEFRRALELNPSYAIAHHWYAEYLASMGRFDEAMWESQRALELDPLSLIVNAGARERLYRARRYDAAIQQLRATLEIDPDFMLAHDFLGQSFEAKGDLGQAIAEFQKAAELSGAAPHQLAYLAHAYAVSGQKQWAIKLARELEERSRHSFVSPYSLALIYAGLGRKDAAFLWLEKAYQIHSSWLTHLTTDSRLDTLRSDPRYQDLVHRVGFPQ